MALDLIAGFFLLFEAKEFLIETWLKDHLFWDLLHAINALYVFINYFIVLIPWSWNSCLIPSPLSFGTVTGRACVLFILHI